MIKCPCTERIGIYYDGELAASEVEAMERHIEQCAACAAELERLRKLSRLMRQIAVPVEHETMTRLHRRLDTTRRNQPMQRFAEICTALAACVLIICGAMLMTERTSGVNTASMPVWEIALLAPPGEERTANNSEENVAQWIMQDLSRNNGNE
jgi:anti-sigma factor RsiW